MGPDTSAPDSARPSSLMLPGDWQREQARRASDEFVIPMGTDFVRADLLEVSLEVKRLWPELDIVQCKSGHDCMELGHYPFMVMERTRSGKTYPVVGTDRLDKGLIERLWRMHREQRGVEDIKQQNEKAQERKRKHRQEERLEQLEVAEAALSSSKYDWRGPNGIRVSDERVVMPR